MIRAFQDSDLESIMSIWLSANLDAHHFVDPEYWKRNFDTVKAMIPQAEILVSVHGNRINGFLGAAEDYIAGIFVDRSVRTHGIGSQLLDCIKKNRKKLTLSVYKKNTTATSFYLKRGFQIQGEQIDPQTAEIEYKMIWNIDRREESWNANQLGHSGQQNKNFVDLSGG